MNSSTKPFTAKILQQLTRSEIVQSIKGPNGGFFIDDENLFFTVGDISGKSISAALFMTTTKLLIKKFALMKYDPVEVFNEVI